MEKYNFGFILADNHWTEENLEKKSQIRISTSLNLN